MAAQHLRYAFCDVKHGTPDPPLTISIFTDCSSSIFILQNKRDTKCTHPVECHWLFSRQAIRHGDIALIYIDSKLYQLADLGTKNKSSVQDSYKLSIVEAPVLLTQS
ncbi:hypothetical protein ACA910_010196 [Epithemia clementina (nom. ined.)]